MEVSISNLRNIPEELKALPQWVAFSREKMPINPHTGRLAKTNDPKTWGTFDQAVACWKKHKWRGIMGVGFVFCKEDPFTGTDLDHCRDPATKEIESSAKKIIVKLDSYTEVSPSGEGVHIIVKGKPPFGGRKKGNVEMYSERHYFTMTGDHLRGTPVTIENRQNELAELAKVIFKDEQPRKASSDSNNPFLTKSKANDLTDEELIKKARSAANGEKFEKLWRGEVRGYNSHNEADMALCGILAFWTGYDPQRVDRLFRESGLMRSKWDQVHRTDGATYGQMTIEKALAHRIEPRKVSSIPSPLPSPEGNEGSESEPKLQDANPPDKQRQKDYGRSSVTPCNRKYHLTDLGNAKRLVARHGRNIRYCYKTEKWLVWDGRRWKEDETGEIERMAKETAISIYHEAGDEKDDERRKAILKHAASTESAHRRKAMIESARSELGIPILIDDLDRDNWLLNVLNGTLDLRTGKLMPHRREDLITKLAPVVYDPEAICPTWWKFLLKVTDGSERLMDFLIRVGGYSLTGDISEQVVFILYGLGANGKTTFVEVLLAVLGDYAKQTSSETLMVKKFSSIPNDIAALRGSRFVAASEVGAGRRMDEERLKQMTGGDMLQARFLFGEFFEFKPTFKIFLAANHKPTINGTDHGIWRRIRLIPFTVQIPADEQDKELPNKLKKELSGILNALLKGCREWQESGLTPPEEVSEATQDFREEMDMLADFINDRCFVDKKAMQSAGDLYQAYTEWAEGQGEKKPLSKRSFGMLLTERGFLRYRSTGGIRVWKGIGLLGRRLGEEEAEETEPDESVYETTLADLAIKF